MIWYSLFITLAISVDSFSIGIAYGIKQVKIPFLSLMIINVVCVGSFSISLFLGNLLSSLISFETAKLISAIILIALGGWLLLETVLDQIKSTQDQQVLLKRIQIKPLGIVINILKEPISADIDVSGNIDNKEACLLGTALSLDSLGVGFGASLGNIHWLYAILFLAIFNCLFLLIGMRIGKYYNGMYLRGKMQWMPSLILIFLGAFKLF